MATPKALAKLEGAEKAVESAVKAAERAGQMGEDGTALGKGASAEAAENAITGMKGDKDPVGSHFAPLLVRSVKAAKKPVKLAWDAQDGAAKYIVYGAKCGKKNKMAKLAETSKAKLRVKKTADGKRFVSGKSCKFIIVTLDSNNNVVA